MSSTAAKDVDLNLVLRSNLPISVVGDTSSADDGLTIGDTSSADSGLMISDTSLVIASVVDDVNGELSGALDKSAVGDTAASGEPAGDGIAELSSFAASVTAS